MYACIYALKAGAAERLVGGWRLILEKISLCCHVVRASSTVIFECPKPLQLTKTPQHQVESEMLLLLP
jgi:hypothetical protein